MIETIFLAIIFLIKNSLGLFGIEEQKMIIYPKQITEKFWSSADSVKIVLGKNRAGYIFQSINEKFILALA